MRLFGYLCVLFFVFGCQSPVPPPAKPQSTKPQPTKPQPTKPGPKPQTALELEGCHNVQRLEADLYSGSQPHGEEAFEALARLGVKTVISVDGAKPQLEEAGRYGLRYVHLPIGYDGVPEKRGFEIARALRDLQGPIYIHCHHGKHRGPAAAAFAAVAVKGWSQEQAVAYMKKAGTSKKYAGLYHSVSSLQKPAKSTIDEADNSFPSLAKLPGLTRSMAIIDRRYGHLKEVRAAAWQVPKNHPDIDPKHEALQLREMLVELERTDESKQKPSDYRRWLKDSVKAAKALEARLLQGDKPGAESAYQALKKSCSACHQKYRNNLVR